MYYRNDQDQLSLEKFSLPFGGRLLRDNRKEYCHITGEDTVTNLQGKPILDATVAPADIEYPTDIDLLSKSREHLETAVDIVWKEVPHTGHKLPYSAKKTRKSYLKLVKNF